jgi:hypothetical protein
VIGDRWGVTAAEVARRYPCDDLVTDPALEAWRGVTVRADVDHVWERVVQIRLAPYSYDWIDNLGRRSPRALQGLPDPVVGDPFTAVGGRPSGRVVAVEARHHLTATIMGAVMSYVLVDQGAATRLLLKVAMRRGRGSRVLAPLVSVGDLVMARRQLMNLAGLAESDPGF